MTLIAVLDPLPRSRVLLGDILISRKVTDRFAPTIRLPTRVYVPQTGGESAPYSYRRKIIEISPNLCALWSGKPLPAKQFAIQLRERFDERLVTRENLDVFVHEYSRSRNTAGFTVLIAPADATWVASVGKSIRRPNSKNFGHYVVAGSGSRYFEELANSNLRSQSFARDVDPLMHLRSISLVIANDLLGDEILTGAPLNSQFGASYEILHFDGKDAYARVDDIIHIFVDVTVSAELKPKKLRLWPHSLRQWYEGQHLYVASFSGEAAFAKGLRSHICCVPSIFDEPRSPMLDPDKFDATPQHLCIHHFFDLEGSENIVETSLVLRRDEIDDWVSMSRIGGSAIRIEHKESYTTYLREMCANLHRFKP